MKNKTPCESKFEIKLSVDLLKLRVQTFSCLSFWNLDTDFVPTVYLLCHFSRVNWWKMTSFYPISLWFSFIFLFLCNPSSEHVSSLFTHQSPPLHPSRTASVLSSHSAQPSQWCTVSLEPSPPRPPPPRLLAGCPAGTLQEPLGRTPSEEDRSRRAEEVKTGCGGEILIKSSQHR